MNLTFDCLLGLKKTKTELSLACNGVWVSRSAVAVKTDEQLKPIFGFGAAFSQSEAETSSIYELLEHLVFLPYAHSEESLRRPVYLVSTGEKTVKINDVADQYLIGSLGPKGIFSANGCAVSTNAQLAVIHSKRELIERHLCCEIWYHRTHSLLPYPEFKIDTLIPSVELKLYVTKVTTEGAFVIASLECVDEGFFALGAALRSNIKDACTHAACETLMLFNDVKMKRILGNSTEQARRNILSLRDREISKIRKAYFRSLIASSSIKRTYIALKCKSIVFEPLPNIYAARTLSPDALEPHELKAKKDVPLLPLF